jgi:hypothetical protein
MMLILRHMRLLFAALVVVVLASSLAVNANKARQHPLQMMSLVADAAAARRTARAHATSKALIVHNSGLNIFNEYTVLAGCV